MFIQLSLNQRPDQEKNESGDDTQPESMQAPPDGEDYRRLDMGEGVEYRDRDENACRQDEAGKEPEERYPLSLRLGG